MKTKVGMKPISDRKVAAYKKNCERHVKRVTKRFESLRKLTNRDLFMILQALLANYTLERVTPEMISTAQHHLQTFIRDRFGCTKQVEVVRFDDKVAYNELTARFKK